MENDLFTALLKYSPTKNNTPKENFTTELFAWLLQNIDGDGYVKAYIDMLCKKCPNLSIAKNSYDIDLIETQCTLHNGKHPDLIICISREDGSNLCLTCEHKIDAELRPGQMKDYKDGSYDYYDQYTNYTVLVTRSKQQWHQKKNSDICILWSDIYKFTREYTSELEASTFQNIILDQFQAYLEGQGMGNETPIQVDKLQFYWAYFHFSKKHEKIRNVSSTLAKMFSDDLKYYQWEKDVQSIKCFSESIYNPQSQQNEWGRTGILFFGGIPEKWENGKEPWKPGLFAGVICDCYDHNYKPKDPAQGPDFVMLLEAPYNPKNKNDNTWYHDFLKDKKYIDICERLKNNCANKGFEFISAEQFGDKKSPWRIACLRKPLIEVLQGTVTYEEQVEALKQTILDGLQLYVGQ